jgi:hypothetical protein
MFVNQMFVDQMFVDQMFFDQMFVDQMFVDQMFVNQMFVDQNTWHRSKVSSGSKMKMISLKNSEKYSFQQISVLIKNMNN